MAVQSLVRGVEILEAVAGSDSGLQVGELSSRVGLAVPTVFNLANTLVDRGLLEKTVRPVRYRLGRRLYELAGGRHNQASSVDWDAQMPGLLEVTGGDSVVFVRWTGGDCVMTRRVDRTRPSVVQRPETPLSTPFTFATGLCVLAFLPVSELENYLRLRPFEEYGLVAWGSRAAFEKCLKQTVRDGFCQPLIGTMFRTAVPVFESNGVLAGALGVSAAGDRECDLESCLAALRSVAGVFAGR